MRIAVWNTAFLGDSVLTLPLIRTLKAAWPEAELDFYVRGGLAPLYEAQPEIARVFSCDKRGKDRGIVAVIREGRSIAERGYDIWVDAHLSLRSSYMAWASRAPVRAGYAEAALSRLVFTHRVSRRFQKTPAVVAALQRVFGGAQHVWKMKACTGRKSCFPRVPCRKRKRCLRLCLRKERP